MSKKDIRPFHCFYRLRSQLEFAFGSSIQNKPRHLSTCYVNMFLRQKLAAISIIFKSLRTGNEFTIKSK